MVPLVKKALSTAHDEEAYQQTANDFSKALNQTFNRAARLSRRLLEWDPQKQYEAHAQLVFRIRDQFGNGVTNFDITLRSRRGTGTKLESLIEDRKANENHGGTITFYLRTQAYEDGEWKNLTDNLCGIDIEVTGTETRSDDIRYLPLKLGLTAKQAKTAVINFQTTIIDIELARLPSQNVFRITSA